MTISIFIEKEKTARNEDNVYRTRPQVNIFFPAVNIGHLTEGDQKNGYRQQIRGCHPAQKTASAEKSAWMVRQGNIYRGDGKRSHEGRQGGDNKGRFF
jgi:hypothetical protein